MFFSKKRLQRYIKLINDAERIDDKGRTCSLDLLNGIYEGNVEQRYEAWVEYIKDKENKVQDFNSEVRNNLWVPAISENIKMKRTPLKRKLGLE